MGSYIEIDSLTKQFGNVKALEDVSLNLEEGNIHGIIGRNGSGKTVMLKCICGFMKPDSGSIQVNGQEVI